MMKGEMKNWMVDHDITDVFGDLLLILLVDEDEQVMFGIAPIIEHPLPSRVVSFVLITVDRDMGGGRGGRCDVLEERRQLILHLGYIGEVGFDKVCKCQDVCEVGDGIILLDSDG
jgi:hypothetical protein